MSLDPKARAEQLRHAVLDFLCSRQPIAYDPERMLARINKSRFLDFVPEPDECIAALTFLSNFTPEPLIAIRRDGLGSTLFYQATSAGVLAWERGTFTP